MAKRFIENTEGYIQNRRKHHRVLVDWPVTIISSKAAHQGKTVNISVGGALIHLKEELDIGESVRLAFEIHDGQDVIIARGEILRTFSLKRGVEQELSHGAALKFTEISDKSLKFFTDNLAPEWKEGYKESGPTPFTKRQKDPNDNARYLLWALIFIIVVPTIYLLYDSIQKRLYYDNLLTQIEGRLLIIEEQINSLKNVVDSFESIENTINDLQINLSNFKKNLPKTDTFDTINLQLKNQQNQIQNIFDSIDTLKAPEETSTIPEPEVQEE